ncbi:hypothetical protein DM02DRAFT_650412 [Periconia macrospinosa]|uniref:Zn(2)-C6 fungal-type domain-containing protein n=1 Tax=Periconia macrospinosa TaxID=97972 RepID=A0A2V1E6M1_9PLEO|nr:hypothetical protein DM02DRAFT_650412 [Periconia macrospinosa]
MFGTFRHQKPQPDHDLATLESTASPFERSSYRISRLACVFCRSKKVKCTGEEQGCQRCLEKQIICSYTTSARRSSGISPRRISRLGQNTKSTNGHISSPDEDMTPLADTLPKPFSLDTSLSLDTESGSSLLYSDYDLTHPSIRQGRDSACQTQKQSFLDAFQTIDTFSFSLDQNLDMEAYSNEDRIILPEDDAIEVPEKANDTTCFCSELLAVFELVKVGQTTGQHHNSTDQLGVAIAEYGESLPFEKEALKSCEKWLSQDASQIKSQHAIMIIEILETLLTSILSMAGALVRPVQEDGPLTPSSTSQSAPPAKKRKRRRGKNARNQECYQLPGLSSQRVDGKAGDDNGYEPVADTSCPDTKSSRASECAW